jgi:ADP-ribosylglycohydrolase
LAILLAANIGGDADSVASIAGAILGARHPASINEDWSRVVEATNDHGLPRFADDLSELRGPRNGR